jgi:hypothetical protein
MRRACSSFALSLVAVAFVLSTVLAVNGQNREKFVISAKAGGVNAVSGKAETRRAPSADWQLLNVTDDLAAGDFVRTGREGLIEMLLNPGAYLRMGEDSEFQLSNNSLEALEIKLIRGIAIIEATGSDDTELAINITTPQAKMMIVRRGLYRVNILPGNATELIVRKGRVLLADNHTKIKSGNKVVFSSTTFSVAKLDKADKEKGDSFEAWSKDRAGNLAQVNQRISAEAFNSFGFGYGFSNYWSNAFSGRYSGVWLFDSRFHCYTFLPFLFGWGSPYGASYPSVFYLGNGFSRRTGVGVGRIVTNERPLTTGSHSGNGSGTAAGSGSSAPGAGRTTVTRPAAPVRDSGSRPVRASMPSSPARPARH